MWKDLSAQTPQEILFDKLRIGMVRLVEHGLLPSIASSPSSLQFQLMSRMTAAMLGRPEFTDLRALLVKHIDFDAIPSLVRPDSPVLLLGAGDVRQGTSRSSARRTTRSRWRPCWPRRRSRTCFRRSGSTATPTGTGSSPQPAHRRFPTEAVHGQLPAPEEIWIIQVNRAQHDDVPETPSEITDRRNHLAGNLSLQHELQIIDMWNVLIRRGRADRPFRARAGIDFTEPIAVHFIRMTQELQDSLDYPSKLSRQPEHIERLMADGKAQASAFLTKIGGGQPPEGALVEQVEMPGATLGATDHESGGDRHRLAGVRAGGAGIGAAAAGRGAGGGHRDTTARGRGACSGRGPARSRAAASGSEGSRGPPLPHAMQAGDAPPPEASAVATSAAGDGKPSGAWLPPHWDKGFVLASTAPGPGAMPFRLVLNHVSQFKYTNSMATNETYTDHNGVVHDVQKRNDIQLTRDVFYFSGYAFDTRLDYNILVFTSTRDPRRDRRRLRRVRVQQGVRAARRLLLAAERAQPDRQLPVLPRHRPQHGDELLAARVHPGRVGQRRAVARHQLHRDDGQLAQHARYQVREHRLPLRRRRVSVWYDRNDFGKAWNDYEHHESVALRIGSAFTYAHEDRLSDLSEASPENNADLHLGRHCSCSRPARWRRA